MAREASLMRTPLAKVRGLGAAKAGTSAFWLQRLTAIALLVLAMAFVFIVVSTVGRDYNSVRALVAKPLPTILLTGFVLAGTVHMQIGMRVIVEDYVHDEALKIAALIANVLFAITVALAALYAVLRIAFL